MHVIFNADDFGLTPGVNLGIAASCQSGVVRSTTLMVGMAAEKDAVKLAADVPSLAVGLHLRFTAGSPLTEAKGLVGDNGQFLRKEDFLSKRDFSQQQVADEVAAQIEHFLATGLRLSHVDSHHHAHLNPNLLPVVQEVVRSYRVPLRGCGYYGMTATDCRYEFSDHFYGDDISRESLLNIVKRHKDRCDVLEIMCHPAYIDQPLLDASGYVLPRAKELEVLTDSTLRDTLNDWGVVVCDYSILSP